MLLAADDSVSFLLALFLGVLMIGGGVLNAVINGRAADGRLAVNHTAGIRTKETMASQEAWQTAHRRAKPLNQFGSMVGIVTGFAVVALSSSALALFTVLLVGVALMTAAVIAGCVVGHRAAREVNAGAGT